jgi:predicted nucleotidyltransferase
VHRASFLFCLLIFCENLLDIVKMERELSDIIGIKVDLRTPEELSRYFRDSIV